MNIKDRLNSLISNETQDYMIELKSESEIFVKDKEIENIIKSSISANDNIILFCGSDTDKYITCNYISTFANNSSVEILNDINEELKYAVSKRIIVPEFSSNSVKKVLECMMEGCKSFVIALNIKSFENIFETFKMLIMLECPNMNKSDIEHIMGVASVLMLKVKRNEDGLFQIFDAEKIYYENNELIHEKLINKSVEISNDAEADIDDEIENIQAAEEVYNILDDEREEISAPSDDTSMEEKPINKYKLLKEKIKKKKNSK